MLTVLDLFSGIGGFSLGLESTGGFQTVAFCEIEPFCREVLRKHWPGVPIHEDVTGLRGGDVGPVDMICGGFPCQDISVAGKGAGLDGKRSGLWSEFARLVGELRPRWVVAENVGALRTRGVDRVCSDLEAEGYSVWPLLVGAWAVGAPHRRERVWIVARRDAGMAHAHARPQSAEYERQREGRDLPAPSSASELDNSEAGRRGQALDAVQAGRDEPERTASGVGLADPYRGRPQGKRHSYRDARSPIHSQSFWNHPDGRGERPVGDSCWDRLEGQRTGRDIGASPQNDTGCAPPGATGPRWPARPGEPQYEWEEPRLAQFGQLLPDGWASWFRWRSEEPEEAGSAMAHHESQQGGRTRQPREGTDSGRPEQPMDASVDGLSRRLVRLARRHNREALKAVGNSVVPQVVYTIAQAILTVHYRDTSRPTPLRAAVTSP